MIMNNLYRPDQRGRYALLLKAFMHHSDHAPAHVHVRNRQCYVLLSRSCGVEAGFVSSLMSCGVRCRRTGIRIYISAVRASPRKFCGLHKGSSGHCCLGEESICSDLGASLPSVSSMKNHSPISLHAHVYKY